MLKIGKGGDFPGEPSRIRHDRTGGRTGRTGRTSRTDAKGVFSGVPRGGILVEIVENASKWLEHIAQKAIQGLLSRFRRSPGDRIFDRCEPGSLSTFFSKIGPSMRGIGPSAQGRVSPSIDFEHLKSEK